MTSSLGCDAVIAALEPDISIEEPTGRVAVNLKTYQAVLDDYLMEIDDQGMKVIETLSQRAPIDTPIFCDLSTNPDDHQQYEIQILRSLGFEGAAETLPHRLLPPILSNCRGSMGYAFVILVEVLYAVASLAPMGRSQSFVASNLA